MYSNVNNTSVEVVKAGPNHEHLLEGEYGLLINEGCFPELTIYGSFSELRDLLLDALADLGEEEGK